MVQGHGVLVLREVIRQRDEMRRALPVAPSLRPLEAHVVQPRRDQRLANESLHVGEVRELERPAEGEAGPLELAQLEAAVADGDPHV
eukprot:scaffold8298_cov296-Pinguiococcus_pyrenoidosus.AAC.1